MTSFLGNERSVLVRNFLPDIAENQLKDIFSEIGSVINFRLFCDNETGRSKGICFCEFKDQEMALNAMRILNGQELQGKTLQVDIVNTDKVKKELEDLQHGKDSQSEDANGMSEKAPEEISKAVASLPAEQMYELMKQMKMCIENNPQEARNLLLQNPQLAYALLQAQVIMRIVDPEVALKILDRPAMVPPPASDPKINVEPTPQAFPQVNEGVVTFSTAPAPSHLVSDPRAMSSQFRPPLMEAHQPMPVPPVPVMPAPFPEQDMLSMGDRDLRQLPVMDKDLRPPVPPAMGDKDMRQLHGDTDFRSLAMPANVPFDPRFRAQQGSAIPGAAFDRARMAAAAHDPRTLAAQARVEDPRKASLAAAATNARFTSTGMPPNISALGSLPSRSLGLTGIGDPQDQEKAALIMQVLQLPDQQIALLPPEQRQSIMILKEQIARSHLA